MTGESAKSHRALRRSHPSEAGSPLHRENRKNGPKNSCQGKNREFGNFAKTRENTVNLVCSSCKFPDPKGQGYCNICSENFYFFQKLDRSAKSVLCM